MTENHPPKLPLRFFRFFCSDERLEELEGDLFEVYHEFIEEKGVRFSSIFYWWIVIRSFRSFALKRTKMKNKESLLSLTFLQHNLKIAWRNIVRRKTTSAINIIGLAIGIGGFVGIYSLISYELSFNKDISDADQIYRVYARFGGAFSGTNPGAATSIPVYLAENASEIETIAHFHSFAAKVKVIDGEDAKSFDTNRLIALVDQNYFTVIDQYRWIAGTPETAITDPEQLVLTREQGEKYFGQISPLDMVGRIVTYQDSLNVTVSGIVELQADQTDFKYTDFISFKTTETTWLKERFTPNDWSSINSQWQTFIKVPTSVNAQQLEAMMDRLNEETIKHEEDPDTWWTTYSLQPLDNLHYGVGIGIFDYVGSPTDLKTLRVLLIIAIALLVIAIFNFINLETVQTINKSKEVGLRKSLGISKKSLIARFLTESILVAFFAALVSLPLSYYGIIYFSEFVPNGFGLDLTSPVFWLSLVLLVLLVGILAGIYPAFIASSFSPAQALQSSVKSLGKSGFSGWVRRILITSQFVFAQLLVIATLAIMWQISFLLDSEMGFKDDGIIYFNTPFYAEKAKKERLLREIRTMPQIQNASFHESPPARGGWSTSSMKYYGADSVENIQAVHQKKGDTLYLKLYDLELVAGRNISDSEKRETLINEEYAKILGFESPDLSLGAKLSNGEQVYEVVGVLKDFHFQSLHTEIEPLMYSYEEVNARCIGMSVEVEAIESTINSLTDRWNEVYPDEPLDVRFLDQTIAGFYQNERRMSRVSSLATVISILISCLGLFGLMSYNVIQKSKELGIRKVLGASLLNIGSILTKEFLILIGIAFLIAMPMSYYFIDNWMEDFSYKTPISWWLYGLGGIMSLVIAIMSVGMKVWKVSIANPVDSLRYE